MTELGLSADELLTTTRSVRKRLDFDRPVETHLIKVGWRLGRLITTAPTAVTQATCGFMTGMALLGLRSVPTSTARRPMITRATRSPCPAMALGWRLGCLELYLDACSRVLAGKILVTPTESHL